MNRILFLFLLSAQLTLSGLIAFADEPSSALDDKPSVDTAAASGIQVPAVPTSVTSDTHTSYLYDLKKLIEKSRENIKEVNDKIKEQAVVKRNQAREERAHEYYEKGLELTNEGKLDEAREYFEKAIRITEHPEMAGYIKDSQRRLRKQEEALHSQEREHYNQIKKDEHARKEDVEEAYREAVDLYKQKKYHPAKDAFDHVDEIAPDYRATKSYLKIIEQNIITADALAVKQQAIEMAHQQKEAEAARAKEKQAWLIQIEEKEKDRKEQVKKQAGEVYIQAVELYKKKKFAEAKKKFEEVSWVIPDYKDTMKYLRRIDRDAQQEEERVAQEQKKALEQQRWEDEVEGKKHEVQRQKELEIRDRQHKKELEEQAEFLYAAAVALFDKKSMDEALVKFIDIEKTCPDYKSTRDYIKRIVQINPKLQSKAVIPSPKVQVALASSMEDQQKQMQDISDLSRRAANLYSKIADIADDRSTYAMKRKMAEVDNLLKNLKQNKEHLLRQMREAEWQHQQEGHKAEAETIYQDGLKSFRAHDYEKAKIKFSQLEDVFPNYKSTQRYLKRIDEYQNNNIVKQSGISGHSQEDRINQLQNNENAQQLLLLKQQQESLKELAQKASDINDDIIRLSHDQDYETMKAKFTQLENTVTALTTLKDAMSRQKEDQKHEKQLARESIQHRVDMLRKESQQDNQNHSYDFQKSSVEKHPALTNHASDADYYKNRENIKEQNMLFSEAVDCYKNKKYSQAKLLFDELASQHDPRADSWLKKVDHVIAQEILRRKEGEERERTVYIAEQVKAQRKLLIFQERERQRQKKLTEELERQKRLFEDDRLRQLRKEETIKAQEHERQLQEEKRLKLEKENEKQQEALRFHRIETVSNASQPSPVPVSVDDKEQQKELRIQREAIRKQLEDGVEAMYQEALGLYKQGSFMAAADKFKDVQDILPGYKRSKEYMGEARQKSLGLNPQAVITSNISQAPTDVSSAPVAVSPSSPVSRDESISKALDLFDSNAK